MFAYLCYSSKINAKFRQFRINNWFAVPTYWIVLKIKKKEILWPNYKNSILKSLVWDWLKLLEAYYGHRFHIDKHNWELDNLVGIVFLLSAHTSGFEVDHTDVIESTRLSLADARLLQTCLLVVTFKPFPKHLFFPSI